MTDTVIKVSNSTELYAALAKATGGETILLEGKNYGSLSMSQHSQVKSQFASEVTIKSADPGNPATFSYMNLLNVKNLTLDTIDFDYTYKSGQTIKYKPFNVSESTNITIRNSTFDGDVASGLSSTADGFPTGQALVVRGGSNITVENNEFFNFTHAAVFAGVNKLNVLDNDVHTIRSDGFDFAGVQNVLIEGNYLHDFAASVTSSDHRDMIQFWTNGTTASKNVIIRGNTLDIGEGNYTQSIFMRNEEVDTGRAGVEKYYQNILIENNTIYNAHLHGITVGETNGLIIRNNSLIAVPSTIPGETDGSAVWIPAINVKSTSTNVAILDNVTSGINGAGKGAGVSGNVLIQNTNPGGPNYYKNLFVDSSMTSTDGSNKFVAEPGSVIDKTGAGSDSIQFDDSPDGVSALFEIDQDSFNARTMIFDATLTVNADGTAVQDDATFLWDFGDGTTATGLVVAHTYADAGKYTATLTVVTPQGSTDSAKTPITLHGADLLSFDEHSGKFISHSGGVDKTMLTLKSQAVATSEGIGLDLGGSGSKASVSGIGRLFGSESFDLSMTLQADGGASNGEVFRVHSVLLGSVSPNGSFYFTLTTADGKVHKLTTSGVKLNDGKAHELDISYDGVGGSLTITVDGKVAASSKVSGDVASGNASLTFGNPWGKKNFEGKLIDLDLDVDSHKFTDEGASTEVIKADSGKANPVPAPDSGGNTGGHDTGGHDTGAGADDDNGTDDGDGGATDNGSGGSPVPPVAEAPVTTPVAPVIPDTGSSDPAPVPHDPASPLEGGFVLDIAGLAKKKGFLVDDASVVTRKDGDLALRLDGDKDYVNLWRKQSMEQSDRIAFSVDYARDQADGSADRLVWNHLKVGLVIEGDGLNVRVATADEGFKTFSLKSLGLNDTDVHNITVMVDQDEDRLQVLVDDKVVLNETSTDFAFTGAGGHEWGWSLGTAWGHYFDGDVLGFQLTDTFSFIDDTGPQNGGLFS